MPLAHAILGFLDYRPMSGYDLKKIFDRSVVHFWSATQSHIYKALEQLEMEGWAAGRVIVQEGKPSRKEYHITPAGRSELQRWVTTPLPLANTREGWLIQLFFSHGSSNEEIIHLLEERGKNIQASLDGLRGSARGSGEESAPPGMERYRRLWQMTTDYGAAYYEAELVWIQNAIEAARRLPPLQTPQENQTTVSGDPHE